MIQIFKHRCNEISQLQDCQTHWGVEIDLRSDISDPKNLYLSHDPWKKGTPFTNWLEAFNDYKIKGPIILNTKEDGLESLTLELLNKVSIKNYLFLDTTLPTYRKWTREKKNPNFFIRWSSIEPIELALANRGFGDWAWVDCFDRVPPEEGALTSLSKHFKTCLVSPELQGGSETEILHFKKLFQTKISGVCTKFPALWED